MAILGPNLAILAHLSILAVLGSKLTISSPYLTICCSCVNLGLNIAITGYFGPQLGHHRPLLVTLCPNLAILGSDLAILGPNLAIM